MRGHHATKPGYVIVYPYGTARPGQAAVEFAAGQEASNVALATPNTYGDFYNGRAAPINLVITTIGAEAGGGQTVADTYAPVTPAPVLPATKVAGNHHVLFAVAGSHGVPANAAEVVFDVTASGGATAGHFTSYPERLPSYPERLPQQQQQGAYWSKGADGYRPCHRAREREGQPGERGQRHRRPRRAGRRLPGL
jgi:hypothetical protein